MKSTFVIVSAVILLTSCSSSAQKKEAKSKSSDIPSVVSDCFKKHFPNASNPDWEKEGTAFEAEFKNGDTETSIVIDINGEILETETEIETTDLPKAALSYIETNCKGRKIKEAAKIMTANGTINYEAEVNNKDFIFDANGLFIK